MTVARPQFLLAAPLARTGGVSVQLSIVGCLGALYPLLRTPMGLRPSMAVFSQAAMVVLTAVFVALCVKSFRTARRSRAARS